jgi:hypothetical protein
MKPALLFVYLFSICISGQTQEFIFKIAGEENIYLYNSEFNAIVNEKCHDRSCDALSNLTKNFYTKCKNTLFYSNINKTNTICLEILKGEISIGQDKKGNELSFCFLKDGSSIVADYLIKICKK